MKKAILDTNVLIDQLDVADFDKVFIPIVVIEELDKLKRNKDEELASKASKAIRMLKNASNVEVVWNYSFSLPMWVESSNDNKILAYAKDLTTIHSDVVFLSNDYNVQLKAKSLGIPVEGYGSRNELYNGWRELKLTTDEINIFRNDLASGVNTYKFLHNEYLILQNKDTGEITEERFDGADFIRLKLPSSKVVKGMNSQQRCAIDLLYNRDIPVKCIFGKSGSGKTLLTTKIGLHFIEEGRYKTLVYYRTPVPVVDIGYLPGNKQEKIEDYCRPLLQYVNSEKNQFHAENLIREEKIKMDTISFLKGANLEDDFIIMDEAEDLDVRLLKLVGTRVAKTSCITFIGDYNQAEHKFKKNNGLVTLIRELKNNPLVGIINLPEDLRSDASKIFADL